MAATTFDRTKNIKVREMRDARKVTTKKKAAPAKSTKKAAPSRSKATSTTARAGDAYAGKKIYLLGDKKVNPRREGTLGYKSLQLVVNKPGITYEDYLAAGGRRVDLKGSLEMKPAQVELK